MSEIESRCKETLNDVDLSNESSYLPHKLRKDQQKILSIACAMIGDPKLLLLDEPTAELDSRRSGKKVQELLNKTKLKMPIIVTTHRLDEAEQWADKIAIIGSTNDEEQNQLIDCKAPLKLKEDYGKCYTITLRRTSDFSLKIKKIQNALKFMLRPDSNSNNEEKSNYEILYPNNEKVLIKLPHYFRAQYAALIKTLEEDCGVEILNISDAALGEVYIK